MAVNSTINKLTKYIRPIREIIDCNKGEMLVWVKSWKFPTTLKTM